MQPNRRQFSRVLTGAFLGSASAWHASGWAATEASAFAGKTVRIVVPLGPGGTADILARLIAVPLGEALGASVIVENRPGAGGAIGTLSVARAAPDGLTLVLSNNSSHAVSPAIQKEPKYHPVKDFTGIGLIGEVTNVLVVSPTLGISSFVELVKMLKAKPGELTYGTPGVGSTGHLLGEQLQQLTGTRLIHVPYKSTAEVSRALLAGEVVVAFDNLPVSIPQIRSKKVVLLGITGQARYAEFPDCPTFAQLGYETLNRPSWFGLSGPAGLSPSTAQTLMDALTKSLKNPDLVKRIGDIGGQVKIVEGKPFSSYVEQAYSIASATAKASKIEID